MIGNKKVLLPVLAFVMAGCVSVPAALAADDLVLFKIHDVTSVKNDEGLVTSCSFGATFYNRSPYTLKSVKLNLSWEDEAIANTISKEKIENNKKNNKKSSDTAATTSAVVSTSVNLYNLDPKSQKTIRAKLDSDRCFLLMNDLKYEASDCSVTSAEGVDNPYLGNEKCTGFFEFVSTENPEYYREFKAISYSEEKANESEARSKERSEINKIYEETLAEFNKVKAALAGIKGDVNPDDIAAAQSETLANGNTSASLSDKIDALFPADSQSTPSMNNSKNKTVSGPQNPFDEAASVNSAAEPEAGKNFAVNENGVNNSSGKDSSESSSSLGNGSSNSSNAGNNQVSSGGGNLSNNGTSNPSGSGVGGNNDINDDSSFDDNNFAPSDNVSGIIGNGVFNDNVNISYENLGYEGKTYDRPASDEKPYASNKEKMIYNSPNAM